MNIAIWGTGQFGHYIARQLRGRQEHNIKFYIDSNSKLWGSAVEGIQVISPDELHHQYTGEVDVVLVAFMDSIAYFKSITASGKKTGFIGNRVFEAKMLLADNLFQDKNTVWNDAPYLNKPILRSLETNIVDDCNLNCRGCSHFSNLFAYGAKIPFSVFCRDLKQVADHVYIRQFNMLGGEALLDDKIIEYIEYARNLLPDSDIELISNGLLIPRQPEEFFLCCKENDITVSISSYKPTLLMKDKIIAVLEKYGITYIFRNVVTEFDKNITLSGTADRWEALRKCHQDKCHFLRDGRIYKCPFEALGNVFFGHFGLDIELHGGTDIYREDLDWEHLIDQLYDEPVDACRLCGKEEKIAWEVANHPVLEDWIV